MEKNKQLSIKQNITRALVLTTIIFFIIQLRGCIGDMNNSVKPKNENIVHSDTVVKYKYLTKWFYPLTKTFTPKDSTLQPLPAVVDTLAILRKFYTSYCYTDTIQDSNLVAVSEIELSENKIRDHQLAYKFLKPERIITITNTIQRPLKPLLMVGVSVSQDRQFSFGIGPQILLISKRRQTIGLGYDVVNKRINANLYLPLQFRP